MHFSPRISQAKPFPAPILRPPLPTLKFPFRHSSHRKQGGKRNIYTKSMEADPRPSLQWRQRTAVIGAAGVDLLPRLRNLFAPGVIVDPTQQDTAQRPPTKTIAYEGPHTPDPHRRSLISFLYLAPIPRDATLPPWTAAPVRRGKAPRRQISRQSSKPILLHPPPATLVQISRQSSKPILPHSPPAALVQISRRPFP